MEAHGMQRRLSFAALTMASTASWVMSPWWTWMRMVILSYWKIFPVVALSRHSPFGLPPVSVRLPKAPFQANSASGSRWMLCRDREERPSWPLQPLEASFRPVSGTPVPRPAMHLAVLMSSPIIQTPLQPAAHAGH